MQQHEDEILAKYEQDLQLLYKLGFDDALSREAIKKHPGNPQQAINYAISTRKQ